MLRTDWNARPDTTINNNVLTVIALRCTNSVDIDSMKISDASFEIRIISRRTGPSVSLK